MKCTADALSVDSTILLYALTGDIPCLHALKGGICYLQFGLLDKLSRTSLTRPFPLLFLELLPSLPPPSIRLLDSPPSQGVQLLIMSDESERERE